MSDPKAAIVWQRAGDFDGYAEVLSRADVEAALRRAAPAEGAVDGERLREALAYVTEWQQRRMRHVAVVRAAGDHETAEAIEEFNDHLSTLVAALAADVNHKELCTMTEPTRPSNHDLPPTTPYPQPAAHRMNDIPPQPHWVCDCFNGPEVFQGKIEVGDFCITCGCPVVAFDYATFRQLRKQLQEHQVAKSPPTSAVGEVDVVAYTNKSRSSFVTPAQKARMIEDGKHGGEFASAARMIERFDVPLYARPSTPKESPNV